MKKEIWKTIEGFENYEVSNLGNIRNKIKGNLLRFSHQPTGYDKVMLRKDGFGKSFFVHRVVAQAFCDNKDNLPEVDHLDHVRDNNEAENLKWVSKQENLLNREWCRPVIMKDVNGTVLKEFSHTKDAAEYVAELLDKKVYPIQVAISQCASHKRPTAYGFKWAYKNGFSNTAEKSFWEECDLVSPKGE